MADLDHNPYAAPAAPLDLLPSGERASGRSWLTGWVVVFGVNLVAPLGFGAMVTRGAGWLGVATGILAMFFISLRWLDRYAALRSTLMVGGVCVGLLQLVPLLQFMAGMLAILIREIVLEGRPGPPDDLSPVATTFLAGFLITTLTGALLLLAALASGFIVRFLKQACKTRNL